MKDKQTEERNELFDSAVREQLTGYEPQVPHALWNRISAELDNGETLESAPITDHREQSSTGKWKLAIAAAVILTLTVGSLLYKLSPLNQSAISTAPVAAKVSTAPAASQPAPAAVQVTEAKMLASTAPVIKKNVKHTATHTSKTRQVENTMTAKTNTVISAPVENIPAQKEQSDQDAQLALAPVLTENKPVEVGNIPLASLNFLSTPSSVNDEITVIKSSDKKKKKHSKKEDESTKIIVIGKKFDSKPDIQYQVPVRF